MTQGRNENGQSCNLIDMAATTLSASRKTTVRIKTQAFKNLNLINFPYNFCDWVVKLKKLLD
jgi:hypothetical protein